MENLINGQVNLNKIINRKINFIDHKSNKEYKLNDDCSVLIVRPRGLHLDEKHFLQYEKRNQRI